MLRESFPTDITKNVNLVYTSSSVACAQTQIYSYPNNREGKPLNISPKRTYICKIYISKQVKKLMIQYYLEKSRCCVFDTFCKRFRKHVNTAFNKVSRSSSLCGFTIKGCPGVNKICDISNILSTKVKDTHTQTH